MICAVCNQPIDGQTFGAEVSDQWCMACWFTWQDGQERVKAAEAATKLGAKPGEDAETYLERLRSKLKRAEDRYGEIDAEIAELKRDQDQVDDKCRVLEAQIEQVKAAVESLAKFREAA